MPIPYLAPMTLYQFNALPYEAQLATVQAAGTYLATRWAGATTAVMRYHLLGEVFAELYYDTETNAITGARAFTSPAPLEDYAHYITLPEGFDALEDL